MNRALGFGVTTILAIACALSATVTTQQAPSLPTYRSDVALVPVDVRVIDANGKPVVGLAPGDFILREDGVRQEIGHFSAYALEPKPPEGDTPPPLRTAGPPTPQKGRLFLFVLGRGRLREPAKALDALLAFCRDGLLPQDRVAVLAWNRATSFTIDHKKVAEVIARFRDAHEEIETDLLQLAADRSIAGTREPTPAIQQRIEWVFKGAGEPTPPSAAPPARAADVLNTRAIASPSDNVPRRDPNRFDISFEQFVRDSIQRDQDLGNLYTGIEYLRYLDGEKHLVFLTQGGIVLDRLEDDLSLAAMANDARVVIDTVQTGGLAGAPAPTIWGFGPSLMAQAETIAKDLGKPNVREELAFQTLKNLSRLTGGVSSVAAYAAPAFLRLDGATRQGYLLGYYPTNRNWNGKYRKIDVAVNRPGVTVMFRHGYFGREVAAPLDRRAFITFNRVAVAGSYDRELHDLGVSVRLDGDGRSPGDLVVSVTIDISHVEFAQDHDRHVASLDVDVFCGDAGEKLVGESWQRADLRLTDATHARFLRDGFVHQVRVPLKGKARYVKAVVYDYTSDRVGSAVIPLK